VIFIYIYIVVSVNFVGDSLAHIEKWLSYRCRNHGKLPAISINEPSCVSFAIGCDPSENIFPLAQASR